MGYHRVYMDYLLILSLVLGLTAWILPIVSLIKSRKGNNKRWPFLSLASLSCCSISLCLQFFYNDYLVDIEDLSAIMDTSNALAFVSAVLVALTVTLNTFTAVMCSKNQRRSTL